MTLKSKIILNALFGACGGFIGWAITQALMRGFFAIPPGGHSSDQVVLGNMEFGLLTGLCIGGALGAADALWSRSPSVSRRALLAGLAVGAFGGIVGLSIGQSAFDLLAPDVEVRTFGSFVLRVFARAVGWSMIGVMLGLAQGAADLSPLRAKHGAIGGLIGGFIGGASFDIVANILRSDSLSRLVSLTLTGFTIGLMIGLIQDLLKQAWIVVLQGGNEGREIPIYKSIMSIGRDELADIPIYADRTVGPRHAAIKQQNNRRVLEDAGSALGTIVNGQRVASQMLKDRDVIEIGSIKLLFREKATASRYIAPSEPARPADHAQIPTSSHICPFCGGVKDASGNCQCTVGAGTVSAPPAPRATVPASAPIAANVPVAPSVPAQPAPPGPVPQSGKLTAMTGPHAGTAFALQPVETTIGREDGRDVFLPNDGAASRRHARIVREESGLALYDEGSSNGTFVNGDRVTRVVLTPGDTITIGATELRFET